MKRKMLATSSFEDRVYFSEASVLEGIMTARCPHCDVPFADFSGCAALQCSSCLQHFCALCGEATAEDGHAHVLRCPSRSFYKIDGVFLRLDEWHRGKAKKNNLEMNAHLLTLPDSMYKVRKRLRRTFYDEESDSDSIFAVSSPSDVANDAPPDAPPPSPMSDAGDEFVRSPAYDPDFHEMDDSPTSPLSDVPDFD